jgi:hypothetical protein
MFFKKYIYMSFLTLITLSVFSACAWLGSFGKIKRQPGDERRMTTDELIGNWRNYSIAFAGGTMEYPSAVMFDPKNDGKKIIYDKWRTVEDQKTLIDLIGWIRIQEDYGPYGPKLYRILGPDNKQYGYIYTAWDHVLLKGVDEKTLWIEDLPHPPYRVKPGIDAGAGK